MRRCLFFLPLLIASLALWFSPVLAEEPSCEIKQLKDEIQRLQQQEKQLKNDMQKLLNRIEDLEKKQAETQKKAVETEEKIVEVEEKAEKVMKADAQLKDIEEKAAKMEKKSLKDRVDFGGEARFRILTETVETDRGFYGDDMPSADSKVRDQTGFPLRIRLNAHVEVVPSLVDVYARLTMNKRWGSYSGTISAGSNPFDRTNSYESSIGHDMTPRFEQVYMTFKIPSYNTTWYVGRLPGMDGPPSRQSRTLFPRLFVDSEIDGTLIKWDAPETSLDKVELPWTGTRLWGTAGEAGKAPSLKPYESKVKDKTGIIIGYLKYDEKGRTTPKDADVYLSQAQVKIGKDTEVIIDGLFMDDWHMPNSSDDKDVPDLRTDYWLAGAFADTQLFGCQVYGAYYYSHFKIPAHSWTDDGTTYRYDGGGFHGHIWYVGFNTGDLISPTMQFCAEYARGDDAWINPFNYRGFRRKGTVQSAANSYFYNQSGKDTVVGFYPFNAGVFDTYFDYYFRPNVRFRIGLMDFQFDENKYKEGDYSILGSNKYTHQWYPYFEVNLSF